MDEIYENMTIDELNVDEKIKKALKEAGVKYVIQLENKNIRRIYELSILGSKYIDQLEEQLYQLGVELKNERDDDETKSRFEKWREEMALKKSESKNSQSIEIKPDDKNIKEKNNEVISNKDKGERG